MNPEQIIERFATAFPDHDQPVTREWCEAMGWPVPGKAPPRTYLACDGVYVELHKSCVKMFTIRKHIEALVNPTRGDVIAAIVRAGWK